MLVFMKNLGPKGITEVRLYQFPSHAHYEMSFSKGVQDTSSPHQVLSISLEVDSGHAKGSEQKLVGIQHMHTRDLTKHAVLQIVPVLDCNSPRIGDFPGP